jgi:hypothetical protein
MLWRIAEALDVPVSFFYDSLRDVQQSGSIAPVEPDDLLTRQNLELMRQIAAAPTEVRAIVTSLLREVAVSSGAELSAPRKVRQKKIAEVVPMAVEAIPAVVVADAPKRRGRPRKVVEPVQAAVEPEPVPEQPAPAPGPQKAKGPEIRTNAKGFVTHINGKRVY